LQDAYFSVREMFKSTHFLEIYAHKMGCFINVPFVHFVDHCIQFYKDSQGDSSCKCVQSTGVLISP